MTHADEQTPEAVEAEDMGERPDLGRTPDALKEALTGTGVGSDTRAGSLQGGAATGSDDDADQRAVDRAMADQGRAQQTPASPPAPAADSVANTGVAPGEVDAKAAKDKPNKDADAATG